MIGEHDLNLILREMKPLLLPDEYIFCTIRNARYGDFSELNPIASYLEKEGLTLVLRRRDAMNADLDFDAAFRCITLNVHSSLVSIGLTAAVSTKLAEKGISANVIAAYYHDHIFVPSEKADEALKALEELQNY